MPGFEVCFRSNFSSNRDFGPQLGPSAGSTEFKSKNPEDGVLGNWVELHFKAGKLGRLLKIGVWFETDRVKGMDAGEIEGQG